MTGWFAVLVVILAAANPAVLAGTRPADTTPPGGTTSTGGSLRLRGVALGLGVVALIALGADAILEALSVSAPTFRTAAGAVVGIGGAVEVVRRRPTAKDAADDLTGGLLSTLLPPLVFAAVTMATDDDWWLTAVALVVTLAATAGLTSAPPRVRAWARITFGGLAVGTGVLLVSAGIRAV